ncbi:uncharacterized mitochondrial protein AtMg01250-like [Rutidosis leptorrhynchoides]|uniref:uncharacterized mitochondrial protein AtMg01250-like n=1 Tax=Rutidosis leptorrhynchoides TaxID=125765 RepID=UPI003A9A0A84
MALMGFNSRWCKWIHACLSSASISILINGFPQKNSPLKKGVRQGDPLFSYLFIMVAEGLNHLTKIAAASNHFDGIRIRRGETRVTHLQYAGHTLFFGDWNRRNGETESMAGFLGCVAGTFPINYLSLPISSSMKQKKAWDPFFEKFGKRIADWKE